jgi:hypothetical protein
MAFQMPNFWAIFERIRRCVLVTYLQITVQNSVTVFILGEIAKNFKTSNLSLHINPPFSGRFGRHSKRA